MTDDVITLDVTWKMFYGNCYLVVVRQSSTHKIVKVIRLFEKLPQTGCYYGLLLLLFYLLFIYKGLN